MGIPGIIIAALKGGSGKTILSVGIIAALKKKGTPVAPFKKGPDYIDAGWLALAAGRPCYNLDTFLIPQPRILYSYYTHCAPADVAVIEGNRGLYDSIDTAGSTSTAELSKVLQVPVLLCIDCTKSTRTMAAVVSGCTMFDPDVNIKGVVLNRVAGKRHESVLRDNIEHHCGISVIGAVPKLDPRKFPERHMGLVPTDEHRWAAEAIDVSAQMAQRYLDLNGIVNVAREARSTQYAVPQAPLESEADQGRESKPRIGVIRDSAFQFYYPENIEALEKAGGEIVFMSPLSRTTVPEIDGLYIGGGFPETHAQLLAENETFRSQLKQRTENGLPVYAECGGLMYLGQELVLSGQSYPMAGVLPIVFGFSKKPQGHGYTLVKVRRPNPYFNLGFEFKGHEFHYSKVLAWTGADEDLAFEMKRGVGVWEGKDGICRNNVLATYTHLHALGNDAWAKAVVRNAARYRSRADKK